MTLLCPRCGAGLIERQEGDVHVDACFRCHGAFYELGDIEKGVDKSATVAALVKATAAKAVSKSGMPCPKGHGSLSLYRCSSPGDSTDPRHVDVDVCNTCKGVWLDGDEAITLKHIAGEAKQVKQGALWYAMQLFSGIPLEIYHPPLKKPVVVPLLVLACVIVFGVQLTTSATDMLTLSWTTIGSRPWTIITHMFVHLGFAHIIGNMIFLTIFGDNIEDRGHRVRFFFLYIFFGLAAAVAHMLSSIGDPTPMGGASGAIAGVMGAYLVLYPRARLRVVIAFIPVPLPAWMYLVFWLLVNLAGAAAHEGSVAWWAHIGGFVAGVGWALLRRRHLPLPG